MHRHQDAHQWFGHLPQGEPLLMGGVAVQQPFQAKTEAAFKPALRPLDPVLLWRKRLQELLPLEIFTCSVAECWVIATPL